jgi:hypothetical protein
MDEALDARAKGATRDILLDLPGYDYSDKGGPRFIAMATWRIMGTCARPSRYQ